MIKIAYEREEGAYSAIMNISGSGPELLRAVAEIMIFIGRHFDLDTTVLCARMPEVIALVREDLDSITEVDEMILQKAKDRAEGKP